MGTIIFTITILLGLRNDFQLHGNKQWGEEHLVLSVEVTTKINLRLCPILAIHFHGQRWNWAEGVPWIAMNLVVFSWTNRFFYFNRIVLSIRSRQTDKERVCLLLIIITVRSLGLRRHEYLVTRRRWNQGDCGWRLDNKLRGTTVTYCGWWDEVNVETKNWRGNPWKMKWIISIRRRASSSFVGGWMAWMYRNVARRGRKWKEVNYNDDGIESATWDGWWWSNKSCWECRGERK